MVERYLGELTPKLGFGFMRLPQKDNSTFDMNLIKNMVDVFLAEGFSYFDTAYLYPGSEDAIREALVERYPRKNFTIANKLPVISVQKAEDAYTFFETSLNRTGAEYFDFYLLHSLSATSSEKVEKFGLWEFGRRLKEKGLIKHFGFSFHGSPDLLENVLTQHPEVEFVQLQINYLDWDDEKVQARRCYEIARANGTPITIMEPVKGGLLAGTASALDIFNSADSTASIASWAMRFAASLDGLITILSGMNNLEQLYDNINTIRNFKPLTEGEYAVIEKVVNTFRSIPRIPCTACRYCVEDCPQKINIPILLDLYSDYMVYQSATAGKDMYPVFTTNTNRGKASDCIGCRICEERCPQGIGIVDIMKKIAEVFG